MKYVRRYLPFVPYVLLGLLVLGPLLAPGFVLTMDMVFTPVLGMPNHVDNTWLFYTTLHVLSLVLPVDFIQKMLLLAILIVSGVGAHRLLTILRPSSENNWKVATYVGATFFMINPFVYDRFMAGQYGVLLGYCLLPWFAASLRCFVRAPGWGSAVRLAAWVTIMSIVSIHSLGWVALLGIGAVLMYARDQHRLRQIGTFGVVSIVIFAIAGAYWLVPTFLGQGRIADSLTTFGSSERQAFATVDTNGTSVLGAVVGLQGFWQDDHQLYIVPIDAVSQWGWLQVVLLFLIVAGAIRLWRADRRLALYATGAAITAILLAMGLGGDWMATHVPFFAGFREPQKFVAVLALVEMYFLTWGASWTLVKLAKVRYAAYPTTALLIGLVLAYTSPMLWGFDGQLQPARYPADWTAMNQFMNAQPGREKVLFLPWHLYMSYNFAGRIIASPAASFFGRPIVASDNPELTGVAPQTSDSTRDMIQSTILPAGVRNDTAAKLRALDIGYVLLAKEYDWQKYDWLNHQAGFEVLRDSPTLRLYKLTNDTIGLHETN